MVLVEGDEPGGPVYAVERWLGLIAELADMPEVINRLLAEHIDDGHGRCRGTGCTAPRHEPGRATPRSAHGRSAQVDRQLRACRRPRDELLARDKVNLDITWLSADEGEELPSPDVIAQEIVEDLQPALGEFAVVPEAMALAKAERESHETPAR